MWISTVSPDLCLNFANTLSWRGREEPMEELVDIPALARWLINAAAAPAATLEAVQARLAAQPSQAAKLLTDSIELREAIYRTFAARASDTAPAGASLDDLAEALRMAPARTQIGKLPNGYGWMVDGVLDTAPALLAPVLWSAGDLIVRSGVNVRQCANEKCLWLFIDESRNGTRRWCDMSSCGNRAKAQRHYRKTKTT